MCEQILRVLKAEQARDKALAALEVTNRDLERRVKERTEQLEMANRELESFSYSVSHHLRAPLRAISRFAHIVCQQAGAGLDPESKTLLENVCASAQQMSELIDGLSDSDRNNSAALFLISSRIALT